MTQPPPLSPPIHRSIASSLHHESVGEGELLILVSGLGGHGSFWNKAANQLAQSHKVVTFDHPGVGKSGPLGRQSITTLIETVIALADIYEADTFTCIGHSTGGLVAQGIAVDYPHRLEKLVLSSTWAKPDERFKQLFALRQHVLKVSGSSAYTLLGQLLAYPTDYFESNLADGFGKDWPSGDAKKNAVQAERIDMLLNYELSAFLPRLKVPTLIVDAPDDLIIPSNHAEQLQNLIPHARRRSLSGGHFTPVTNTDEYVRLIEEFISNHE